MTNLQDQILQEMRESRQLIHDNKIRLMDTSGDIRTLIRHLHNWRTICPAKTQKEIDKIIDRLENAARHINAIEWGSSIDLPMTRDEGLIHQVYQQLP